jgi:hypothetical protein
MDERQQRVEAAWGDYQRALKGLPDECMSEPGVVEGWSVKDVIAHVSFWEEYLVERIEGHLAGRSSSSPDVDTLNAEIAAERSGWSPRHAREHTVAAHARMLEVLAQNLDAPERLVAVNTWEHYAEHGGHVRKWRERPRI